ncbi:MAG: hypothetical protein ABIQ01_03875 [Pseudolysinimonas sp.]
MPRLPIVSLAIVATLLLAACSAPNPDPAEPVPEGSTLPTTSPTPEEQTPTPVSRFEPCDDADRQSLAGFYSGDYHDAPTDSDYPDFLPLPSCVFEQPGQVSAIFLGATDADLAEITAAITEVQGVGTPSTGGFALAGEQWTGSLVFGIFLVGPGVGADVQYIAVGMHPEF